MNKHRMTRRKASIQINTWNRGNLYGRFLEGMLMTAMKDEYAGAKALASYMFRDLVDNIHSEGKITEAEMEQLNREACNRAALFLNPYYDE